MPSEGERVIKVLLVDDDTTYANLIGAYLSKGRRKKYALDVATTLTDGHNALAAQAYDVVLLDLGLPDCSGIETLINTLKYHQETPVLVLTGLSDEATGTQAVGCGAQDYLLKDEISDVLLERSILYTIERFRQRQVLKEKEEKLRDSERRFRAMIEKSLDGFLVVDEFGIVKYMNAAAEALFGRPAAHFVGEHVSFAILPETPVELEIMRKGRDKVVAELRTASVYMTFSKWNEQKVHLINFRDITHRKKMEEELRLSQKCLEDRIRERTKSLQDANRKLSKEIAAHRESEQQRIVLEKQLEQAARMEAIGTLAGGIAHDFNNILTSAIGFAELALDQVETGSLLEDNIQEVYRAGIRAKGLVQHILAFSRQADHELKPVQVKAVVEEALKLLRPTLPTSIAIAPHLESTALVLADSTQIHQIIMNLCTNAACAMGKIGGLLTIALSECSGPSGESLLAEDMASGGYIKLVIADTGSGIAREHLSHIFEPYFTTKPAGEGTGLGLSVVYGLVKSLGGETVVDSEIGSGTSVSVYLPILKKREFADLVARKSDPLPGGSERILLVDDEIPIVKMVKQRLEKAGYIVESRTSSIEALALFDRRVDGFDLVITDMTMPHMTGDRLAIELRQRRPDLPVILCTGYSKKISDERVAEIGVKAVLMKPLSRDLLLKTVRNVLDEKQGATQG